MEKKLLALGSNGKLIVKSVSGKELSLSSNFSTSQGGKAVVFLLVDCSASMQGEGIKQAKQGTLDFSRTAIKKGYLVGLIKFDSSAELLCEPTARFPLISSKIEEFTAAGDTNLTEALRIVCQKLIGKQGYRGVVVATDGYPNESSSALEIAEEMKKDKIEILAISTPEADQEFLSRLVSRKDLNLRMRENQFKEGLNLMAGKLPFKALGHSKQDGF